MKKKGKLTLNNQEKGWIIMRLKLNVIQADRNFPGPTQTRIEFNHIIDDFFIGGKQYCYPDLECLVEELKKDLDLILKKGKKFTKMRGNKNG